MLKTKIIHSSDYVKYFLHGFIFDTRMRSFFNFNEMEKICRKCGESKLLKEFSKYKIQKDGLMTICKICSINASKKYSLTIEGVMTAIYGGQRRNSRRRNHPLPTYSKKEFTKFCMDSPDFIRLYNNWVKSCYKKLIKPTFDRLRDDKGYSFENFNKWMTWKDNKLKGEKDRSLGKNQSGFMPCKAVIGTHIETGEVIEFYSIAEAARETGIHHPNISKVCLGQRNHTGGYSWKHKKDK